MALPDENHWSVPLTPHMSFPAALGWLFIAESLSLSHARFFREACKLGLSEQFGARHLGGVPRQIIESWRGMATAVDCLVLDEIEERRLFNASLTALYHIEILANEAQR